MSPLPKGTFIQVSQTWMKVWGLQLYLKRDSQVFSCEFVKFRRTPILKNTSGRFLLNDEPVKFHNRIEQRYL